jgi:hypothetical protein
VHAYRTHVVLSRMVEDRAMWGVLPRGLSDGDAHTGRPGDQTALNLGARGLHTGRPALPRARPASRHGGSTWTPTCRLLHAPVVACPRRPRAS